MQVNSVAAAATDPTQTNTTSSTNPLAPDQLANESTFLKLLMAQVQNQDPMNPTDSTQFIGQLVQFSQLEQLLGINQGVQSLIAKTPAPNPAPGSGSPVNSVTP